MKTNLFRLQIVVEKQLSLEPNQIRSRFCQFIRAY